MDVTEMRKLLSEQLAAKGRHDARAVAATFADDGVYENRGVGLRFEGRDAVEMQFTASYQMTPDMQARYHAEIVGHNVIVMWGTVSGTIREHFMGVPTSGPVRFGVVSVIHFGDTLVARREVHYDLEDLCTQLGVSSEDVRANLAVVRTGLATSRSGRER